jgi:hypothetical protein
MRKSCLLVSLVAAIELCSAASAATVFYSIEYPAPGQFNVRVRASAGDNFGIAAYGVVLQPKPSVVITALDHNSPRALVENPGLNLTGPLGFTVFRSPDNSANLKAHGSQDTISPTPFIIRGYGQQAGNLGTVENAPITVLGGVEGPSWAATPIVATGTYTAPSGTSAPIGFDVSDVESVASVFLTSSGLTTISASIIIEVPEPSAFALGTIALVGGAATRRRRG